MEEIIRANELTKEVEVGGNRLRILDNINFAIPAGASVAITGSSGAGKSTLLSLLAGLDQPTYGYVELAGTNLTALDEDARALVRNRDIGFVFQSFHLLAGLTALENVMLPAEIGKQEKPRKRATELLKRVGLGDRLTHYPRQLSGGEQQRVALARAFICRPNLLFADEPSGSLDTRTGEAMIALLFELNRDYHTTLVVVTHEDGLAQACDQQLQLHAGRLV